MSENGEFIRPCNGWKPMTLSTPWTANIALLILSSRNGSSATGDAFSAIIGMEVSDWPCEVAVVFRKDIR